MTVAGNAHYQGGKSTLEHVMIARKEWLNAAKADSYDLVLPVFAFELLHERNERVDAVFWKRVVNRGAHPSNGPVPFQAIEPGRVGFLDERRFQLF